jgi:hypothetical protein
MWRRRHKLVVTAARRRRGAHGEDRDEDGVLVTMQW